MNILPAKVYANRCHKKLSELQKTNQKLVMFNGTETKPEGKIKLTVENPINKDSYKLLMLRVILGSEALENENDNIQIRTETVNFVTDSINAIERTGVFHREGKLAGELKLELDKTVKPVKIPVRKITLERQS